MKISQIQDIYVIDGRKIVLHFDDIDNFIMEVPSVSSKIKISDGAITDIAKNSMPIVAFNTGKITKELMVFSSQDEVHITNGTPHTVSVFFSNSDRASISSIPNWITPESTEMDSHFIFDATEQVVKSKYGYQLNGLTDITYFCRKKMKGYNYSQKNIDKTYRVFINFLGDNGKEYTIVFSQAALVADFGIKSERKSRINSMMAIRITPLALNKTGYWSILEKEEVMNNG